MRIAALYDIHGNAPALESVLKEIEQIAPDALVVGGDVVAGPFPVETLALLESCGRPVHFIRGNADREVVRAAHDPAPGAGGSEPNVWEARARWVAARLAARHHELLASWPETVVLSLKGLGPTLFCHGSPRSDEEIITRATPERRLAEMLAGVEPSLVVCGHTHVQFDRRVGGKRVINAGSVGLPYEGRPGAIWTLLGPDVEPRATAYDHEATAAVVRTSGFPEADDYATRFLLEPFPADQATALFERMAEERERLRLQSTKATIA